MRVRSKDVETEAFIWDGSQGAFEQIKSVFKDDCWRNGSILRLRGDKLLRAGVSLMAIGDYLVFVNGYWLPLEAKTFHQSWDKCAEVRHERRTTDVDLLLNYGEWLDAEHLIKGNDDNDRRTHEDLAKEFLDWRAQQFMDNQEDKA